MALTDKLTAVANAIRAKTGESGLLTLSNMPSAIAGIQTGSSGSSGTPFKYGGMNSTLVASYSSSWTLADTSFVIGSSASTSATPIRLSASNAFSSTSGSPTYAYGSSDIIVVQKCLCEPTHSDSASGTYQMIRHSSVHMTYFSKRKTSNTSAKTMRQAGTISTNMLTYLNGSGSVNRYQGDYGFYLTPSAAAIASTNSSNTYVKCSRPITYYCASNTYESPANIKCVTACDFKWGIEVYVVDSMSSPMAALNDDIDNMLVNGL